VQERTQTVDVLVVGAGAGAMVAAITASDHAMNTLVIEKGAYYGGSSAMSGGGLWIPNNHLMRTVGIDDSPEDALAYLQATTHGLVAEDRLRAYVKTAPEMLRYLCERTRLQVDALPEYPDYYTESPGYRPGGRCLEPRRVPASILGEEFPRLREGAVQSLIAGRIFMTIKEARTLLCRGPGWIGLTLRLMSRYWLDLPWRLRSRRDRSLTMGNALVAMLRRSMMDRGIPLWLDTPAREIVVEGGRVVGVVAEREGQRVGIRATRA
jgi:3-oxosteroid 1-dehydrogenase